MHCLMIWDDNMYVGKECLRSSRRLQFRIAHRMTHKFVYLIALPQSEHTVLEMIPSVQLLQKAYPADALHIVGMGADRAEAMSLLQEMIRDIYEARGDFDAVAYFRELSSASMQKG